MAKIKYPETDEEKAKLYVHAMLEIKERVDAMNHILSSTSTLPLFKHEMCQLHLRHICEIISIACLAAQGDYETQRAFTEEYSPAKIFSALRKLTEHFFPEPCTVETKALADGRRHHHLTANAVLGAYTEKDIVRVWGQSGNFLHRATIKKYLSTSFDKPPQSLDKVVADLQGIVNLMAHHVVAVRGDGPKRTLLQVTLDDGTGHVAARFLRLNTDDETVRVEEFRGSVVKQ